MSPDSRAPSDAWLAKTVAVDPIEVQLPAVPESVTVARHDVAQYLHRLDVKSFDIESAVTEAVKNAVVHGFRSDVIGTIWLRIEVLVPDTLVVSVEDDGVGVRPDPQEAGLGLGLGLIGRFSGGFDVLERHPHGTIVRMRFGLTA